MEPIQSIFVGHSYKTAQAIHRMKPLVHIFCERRQFNIDLFNFARLIGARFSVVEKREDLCFDDYRERTLAISQGTGVIFTQTQIDSLEYGIWNIHTGKLPELRGRHPISWAFLKNHERFFLSIHEMNAEIDQGYLLAEEFVFRDVNDTQKEIEQKFEKLIEDGLIRLAYTNYFNGQKRQLLKGTYTKSLIGGFDSIDPEKLSSEYLFNLCRAQATFGGISVRGKSYKKCVFIHPEFEHLYTGYLRFKCADGVEVGLIEE